MAIFGQRLAQAESEYRLAIGQVADDLTRAPLARRTGLFGTLAADGVHQCAQLRRRGRNHFQGIEVAQLGGIRIQHIDPKYHA